MNNFENCTPNPKNVAEEELLNQVTEQELKTQEKLLIRDRYEDGKLTETLSEVITKAKEINLPENDFRELIIKMVAEFPSGETLTTMFGETDFNKTFTHEEFVQAWAKTGWPKLDIEEYAGEKSLGDLEKMIVGGKN